MSGPALLFVQLLFYFLLLGADYATSGPIDFPPGQTSLATAMPTLFGPVSPLISFQVK